MSNGGMCLAIEYKNNRTKMLWECNKGHQWYATLLNIKQDKTWCPDCSNRRKLSLKESQQVAQLKNGKCLSNKYVDIHTKMLWECEKGHQWQAELNSVKNQGTWCPNCAIAKRNNTL